MKEAQSKLDFYNDKITMFGQEVPLQNTSSGHYCIPIVYAPPSSSVLLSIDHLETMNSKDKKVIAIKLHKQFGHPLDSEKLNNILVDANILDDELTKLLLVV